MPIRFSCACGKALVVPDDKAGTRGRCPQCKTLVDIPGSPVKPAAAPPTGEAPPLICPRCGGIEEATATVCSQCRQGLRVSGRVIQAERPTLLDAAPFRWINEYKLWIGGVAAVLAILVLYRVVAGPSSPAFQAYRSFADQLLRDEYDAARRQAGGAALKQIDQVRQTSLLDAVRRAATEPRSVYTMISEQSSGDETTLRVTQRYWRTVTGSLQVEGDQQERDHTARLVRKDGQWIVTSFEMGPPRPLGSGSPGAIARTSFVKVEPAGFGVSAERPLGSFKSVHDRMKEAGLSRAAPREDDEAEEGEPTRTHLYEYHLPAKKGPGWPESIELVITLERKIKTVRASFQTAGGPVAEESRVARFAADFWKMVAGKAPALEAGGKAREVRGDLTAEWSQDRVRGKELVAFSLKTASRPAAEGSRGYARESPCGRASSVGVLPGTGEPYLSGQNRLACVFHHQLGYVGRLDHPDAVTGVARGPDGMSLTTACADGMLREWRRTGVDTRFVMKAEWAAHAGGVTAVVGAPGGDGVASAGPDGTIKIWAATATKATLRGPKAGVACLSFRPDGILVASAGRDGTVQVWDVDAGTEMGSFAAHSGEVLAVAFDPGGRTLASGGADGLVKLWNLEDRSAAATFKGHEGAVKAVLFQAGGRLLVSAGEDGAARVWDTGSRELLHVFRSFAGLTSLASGREAGRFLLAGDEDGFLQTWNLPEPPAATRPEPRASEPPARTVSLGGPIPDSKNLLLSADGRTLAVWHRQGGASLWSTADGRKLPAPAFGSFARCGSLSADGRSLALGLANNSIRIFDAESGRETAALTGLPAAPLVLALSADGRKVAAEFRKTSRTWVQVMEPEARKPVCEFEYLGLEARTLAFAPDGRRIAVATADGRVHLFDAATGALLRRVTGHEGEVVSLAFSPDGALLATGSADGTARAWNVSNGAQLKLFRIGGRVASVAFGPGQEQLAAAGEAAMLQRLKTDGEPRVLEADCKEPGILGFAPDGREVMRVDAAAGMLRFWPVSK